jgi:hypothetical protein
MVIWKGIYSDFQNCSDSIRHWFSKLMIQWYIGSLSILFHNYHYGRIDTFFKSFLVICINKNKYVCETNTCLNYHSCENQCIIGSLILKTNVWLNHYSFESQSKSPDWHNTNEIKLSLNSITKTLFLNIFVALRIKKYIHIYLKCVYILPEQTRHYPKEGQPNDTLDNRKAVRKCKIYIDNNTLNFNDFRVWTSELPKSTKVALEVSCGPNGRMFLPWPMKAKGLVKLEVRGIFLMCVQTLIFRI